MPRLLPKVRGIRKTLSGGSGGGSLHKRITELKNRRGKKPDKDDNLENNNDQSGDNTHGTNGATTNNKSHAEHSFNTTVSLTEGDADWIVRKTETRVAETVAKSRFIQSHTRLYNLPRFSHDDMELGDMIANGGFCEVRAIKSFFVANSLPDGCGAEPRRYVIKHLAPKLVSKPKQLAIGAKDLVMEGYVLSALDHENILQVKGFASSGVSGYANTGRIDGFFLVLPRLDKTLHKQLHEWRVAVKRQQKLLASSNNSNSSFLTDDGGATDTAAGACPAYEDASTSESDLADMDNSSDEDDSNFDPETFPFFTQRLQTAVEIASAISYCHRNRILYRDLKPANVGYSFEEDRVKLFDFGLAVELPPSNDPEAVFKLPGNTGTGKNAIRAAMDGIGNGVLIQYRNLTPLCLFNFSSTARYMAPEVVKAIPYGLKADVFSFCMLLHEIMALIKPFDKLTGKEVKEQVAGLGRRPVIDKSWPIAVRRLLRRGFSESPELRPRMDDIQDILEDVVECF